MEINDIKRLIELFDKSDLRELEIEENDTRIRLKKGADVNNEAARDMAISPIQRPAAEINSLEEAKESKETAIRKNIPEGANYVTVESPMVGAFYRASAEGAEPYVNEGDTVKKGQVLCIIEAMKLMNEIEAEVGGKIVSIIPENAQPVEYGEPLIVIEKL